MTQKEITELYFQWLCNFVCNSEESFTSYSKLLLELHTIPFTYLIPKDSNRAGDGAYLRYRFNSNFDASCLPEPCSVLEMLVALAVRCEETIMNNTDIGDRTGFWFWDMIISLDLLEMTNTNFSSKYVNDVICTFLNHDYAPNGAGGLFTIPDTQQDLRNVEIWIQLCWYLDSIIGKED